MTELKVGFTGTQVGLSWLQRKAVTGFFRAHDATAIEFHHGDCIGADAEASQIARAMGARIVLHPPINRSKRAFSKADEVRPIPEATPRDPDGYFARNHAIVEEADILLACPKGNQEEQRSGTWATIRYARKLGKKVLVLERG